MLHCRNAYIAIIALAAVVLGGCAQNTSGQSALPQTTLPSTTRLRNGWLLSPAARTQPVVYVSDNSANAIEIYPQRANSSPIGQITDGISAPLGNFVDQNGTLYVANIGNNTVTEYPKGSTTPSVTLSNDISGPITVAADRSGDVAVGEFASSTILEFPAGSSNPSVTITLLTQPEGLAFDRNGHLYAAWNVNTGSKLIGHVSKCEQMKALCSERPMTEGESGGLVLDSGRDIALGDQTNHVINVYAPHATSPTRTIAMSGHDPYKFELNQREKKLYVADIANNDVLIFDYATGTQVGTISSGLHSAWGVSLSPAAKDGP